MNETYNGLVEHFGKELGKRIFACALIMAEKAELIDEETGAYDIAMGARYTIGALKRMRRQATKHVTWADVVDRLENEQVEGRHYGMAPGALTLDVKRIELINENDYVSIKEGVETIVRTGKAFEREQAKEKEVKAVTMVQLALAQAQEEYNMDTEKQAEVAIWVKQYLDNVSKTKRAFLTKAMDDYKARKDMDPKTMNNLCKRYAPKNVKAVDFLELLIRYA